jgi:hypothetical protein
MAKRSIRGVKRPVFDLAEQAASSRLGVDPEWLESSPSTDTQRFTESELALNARGKTNLEDQETVWVRFHPRHGWYVLEPGEQLEDEHDAEGKR